MLIAFLDKIKAEVPKKNLQKKIHVNIINQLKITIQQHNNLNGYGSGGYSSAGYLSDSLGYESPGSQMASGKLPIDVVSQIMETENFELLGMLINEIYTTYEKIGNIQVNKKQEDLYMFHLHFVKKLSARLKINQSAFVHSKLEKYLKQILESYICDKFINSDRQTIRWIKSSGNLENKLSLLPMICKFGHEKTSIENAQNDEIYVIKLTEED